MQSPLQGKGRGPNIGTSVPASTRRTPRSRPNSTSPWHLRPTLTSNSGFVSPCGWVVASPPWRRGPQVRAPWRHGGHGVVDVVGPVAPPGRASGRDDSGVYTDRRKQPLGAVLGHSCTLLRREGRVWWHERPSRHGVPAVAPRWPAPPLAGKTGSARVTPPPGWRFH